MKKLELRPLAIYQHDPEIWLVKDKIKKLSTIPEMLKFCEDNKIVHLCEVWQIEDDEMPVWISIDELKSEYERGERYLDLDFV